MENQDEKKHNKPNDGPYNIIGPTVFDELSTYTYTLVPANGNGAYWEVEGGILTAGQMTDTVTVQWNDTSGQLKANVISDITILDTSVGGFK